MQTVDKNGRYGEPVPFDPRQMNEFLQDAQVDHVQVFNGTKENIEKAKLRAGKKRINHTLSRGFKKAPRIKR